jgi:AcrR family transcriptional regulator
MKIVARDGATALTVRAVARASGCSTTGVYTYFSGRPGLLDAMVIDGFALLDAALDSATAGLPAGMAELAARCSAYMTFAKMRPAHYSMMFDESVPGFTRSVNAQRRGVESFVKLRDSVAGAIASGELDVGDATPAFVAGTLWATLHGHVVIESLWPGDPAGDLPWRLDADAAITWLLRGITARA